MRFMKKSLALIMAAILTASFSGCRKNTSDTESGSYYLVAQSEANETTEGQISGGSDTAGSQTAGSQTVSGSGNVSGGSIVNQDLTKKYKNLNGRKITVVGWWDATQAGTEEDKLILEVEKLFNCDLVEKKLTDYAPLYTSILAGNPICDLFVPRDTSVLNMANKNMLIALDSLSTFDANDPLWNPATTAESTLNGHVYGMTADTSLRDILFYNKDMFNQNGWTDLYDLNQQGALTWDALYNVMSKAAVVDAGGNVTRYGFAPKFDFSALASFMLNMNGVRVVSRQGDSNTLTNTLNTGAATNTLNILQKWNSSKGQLYDTTAYGWADPLQLFLDGKAAMLMADKSQMDTLKSAGFNVGAVVFPHGPDTNTVAASYEPSSVVIPKGVKNAEDVALFWSVREAYNKQNRKQSVYDTLSDPSVKATCDQLEQMLWNKQYVYDFADNLDLDLECYRKVAVGSQTPQEAIQSIQQVINGKISDYWK